MIRLGIGDSQGDFSGQNIRQQIAADSARQPWVQPGRFAFFFAVDVANDQSRKSACFADQPIATFSSAPPICQCQAEQLSDDLFVMRLVFIQRLGNWRQILISAVPWPRPRNRSVSGGALYSGRFMSRTARRSDSDVGRRFAVSIIRSSRSILRIGRSLALLPRFHGQRRLRAPRPIPVRSNDVVREGAANCQVNVSAAISSIIPGFRPSAQRAVSFFAANFVVARRFRGRVATSPMHTRVAWLDGAAAANLFESRGLEPFAPKSV